MLSILLVFRTLKHFSISSNFFMFSQDFLQILHRKFPVLISSRVTNKFSAAAEVRKPHVIGKF